jgi:type I restriction enzyme, S subunit
MQPTWLDQDREGDIKIKEDQIAALKEYKTSLINAAVTGKIRVT